MTHLEQAIKDAFVGGYLAEKYDHASFKKIDPMLPQFRYETWDGKRAYKSFAETFLDPAFWQALGKARGWTFENEEHGNWDDLGTMTTTTVIAWKHHWHRFIDHLAEGKDIESFFASISTNN